jgi:hypothetical protein
MERVIMVKTTHILKSLLEQCESDRATRKTARERAFHDSMLKAQEFINRNAHTVFVNMKTGHAIVCANYRIVVTLSGSRAIRWQMPKYTDVRWLGNENEITAIHLLIGGKLRADGIALRLYQLCRVENHTPTQRLIRDVMELVK